MNSSFSSDIDILFAGNALAGNMSRVLYVRQLECLRRKNSGEMQALKTLYSHF